MRYKVNVVTPILRILKQGEAQAILGGVSSLIELDPSMQMVSTSLKINDMASYYLDLVGVPNRFINTPEEIQAEQDKMAEQQAQAGQQAVETDVQAQNAIAMGKADANVAEDEAING